MSQTQLITELEALVGKENVLADSVDLVALQDAHWLRIMRRSVAA